MWTYTLNILYLNYIEMKVVTSLCLGKSLQFVAHIAFLFLIKDETHKLKCDTNLDLH